MDTIPARILKHRVVNHFINNGWGACDELTLPNGRRLDVLGVGPEGGLVGIETKVTEGDLRSDTKWPDYMPFLDALFFALPSHLPSQYVHTACGLIIEREGRLVVERAPSASSVRPDARIAVMAIFAATVAARYTSQADYIAYMTGVSSEPLAWNKSKRPKGVVTKPQAEA